MHETNTEVKTRTELSLVRCLVVKHEAPQLRARASQLFAMHGSSEPEEASLKAGLCGPAEPPAQQHLDQRDQITKSQTWISFYFCSSKSQHLRH